MEGKEWVWDNGVIREVDIHEMKKTIERAKRIELAEKNVKRIQKVPFKIVIL